MSTESRYNESREEEFERRMNIIGQNGPTGEHYDVVEHPKHYTSHVSGVECITVTEQFNFCKGNAIKYIWRAGEKGDEVEDLRKAIWYLQREVDRVSNLRAVSAVPSA